MSAILKVENLTVSYPRGWRGEKVALSGVSFEIKKGEILGLLGPNGAGKTTLLKSILGFIQIKSGKISLFGQPHTAPQAKRRLGFMPEIANYYWFLTPEEILTMFGELSRMPRRGLKRRVDETLSLVGLAPYKKDWIRNFSKGMQERLSLAQALLHEPEFLILDEPFSGLDPVGRIDTRNIFKRLKEQGATILLSSHELSEAELVSDHVAIMKAGRILRYGPTKELLEERGEHSLEKYFFDMIA